MFTTIWDFFITALACYAAYLAWSLTGQIARDWLISKIPGLSKFSNSNNVPSK